MVANKEYIADQSIESVAKPYFLLIGNTLKESLHLYLGIHLCLQLITLIIQTVQILLLHLVSTLMEHTVEHPVGDKWTGESVLLEVKTIRANLVSCHAECRSKLSEQTMNRVDRNLPYTEEAQHVVDTISIKELRHILESTCPPLTVVFQHLIPVVGRESPVLTIHREIVRWSSCLSVEVEVLRLCPYITSKTVYTDRNITLQDDSLGHGMLVSSLHLCVQHKLYEVEELHLLVGLCSWVGQCLAVFLVPSIVVRPLREISSAILIAQTRILCIRHQPLFCILEECLIFGTLHHLFTFLIEDLVQVRYLEIIYLFIIYLGQGIELCSCLLSLSTSLGILKLGQSLQVGILWMNGKHADTAVGIRVCPGVSDGRIVDRQQLKHLLSSLCHQVDHTLQVSEVAYTRTLLTAK